MYEIGYNILYHNVSIATGTYQVKRESNSLVDQLVSFGNTLYANASGDTLEYGFLTMNHDSGINVYRQFFAEGKFLLGYICTM